jgi:hypothetical protein
VAVTSEKERRQEVEWQELHDRVTAVLDQYGRKDPFGDGDYWLVDENWGWRDLQLGFQNLALLQPHVITSLQALLAGHPDWQITIEVDAPDGEASVPPMGLVVFHDKIVDELQRDHLPEPYRSLRYEASDGGADEPKA